MTATPDSEGFVDVIERVRPANPIRQLTLEPPPAPSPNDDPPQVLALTLYADGKQVDVPATTSRDYLVLLPVPATSIVLHYRLSGVISRDPDARRGPGAGAAAPPDLLDDGDGHGRDRDLRGPGSATSSAPTCRWRTGSARAGGRDGWRTASMENKDATVVAQIDLPGASPQT